MPLWSQLDDEGVWEFEFLNSLMKMPGRIITKNALKPIFTQVKALA